MNNYEQVREFHQVMKQPVGSSPQFITPDRMEFRISLIDEEYDELLKGIKDDDLTNVAKEMADMLYVIHGLAVEMGIDLDAVFREVHRSNMTKVKDGQVNYRDDGKVLKPDTYQDADIEKVLFQ